MRLGVLDIGSNTVHLLVMDARVGGPPIPAASHKSQLRLAEHIEDDGSMSKKGANALIEMVASSREFAEDTGCSSLLPFVTSALREATNCDEVIERCKKETGVELRVLSGTDESRLTFLSARRWYGWSAGTLGVFDIGGGSLEIAAGSDEEPHVALSVPLGAGRLTRDFGSSGNTTAMRRHARTTIGTIIGDVLRVAPFDKTVGTSKTFRTLGRIAGAAPASEGPYVPRVLHREALRDMVERLDRTPVEQRAALPGVSEGRAPQILAGAVVAEAVMELAGIDHLDLCPWAVREGVIVTYLDHLDFYTNGSPSARALEPSSSPGLVLAETPV